MPILDATDAGDPYTLPRPGRIKLKESSRDVASKIFRSEQKRFQKQQERISRINNIPPITPPTIEDLFPAHPSHPSHPSFSSHSAFRHFDMHMDMDMDMDESFHFGHPFNGPIDSEPAIPARHRPSPSFASPYTPFTPFAPFPSFHPFSSTSTSTLTAGPQYLSNGLPGMNNMTPEEYSQFIRGSFSAYISRLEASERAQRRMEALKRDRRAFEEEERMRESAERRERRRDKRRRERERERDEEVIEIDMDSEGDGGGGRGGAGNKVDKKKEWRERYKTRWKSLGEVNGEIIETNLTYQDIPWPFYPKPIPNANTNANTGQNEMEKGNVKSFMLDMARENGEDVKKTLREGIRAFHPDRFYARVLPRVREGDRERVKEGVEVCSRIINSIAAEVG